MPKIQRHPSTLILLLAAFLVTASGCQSKDNTSANSSTTTEARSEVEPGPPEDMVKQLKWTVGRLEERIRESFPNTQVSHVEYDAVENPEKSMITPYLADVTVRIEVNGGKGYAHVQLGFREGQWTSLSDPERNVWGPLNTDYSEIQLANWKVDEANGVYKPVNHDIGQEEEGSPETHNAWYANEGKPLIGLLRSGEGWMPGR